MTLRQELQQCFLCRELNDAELGALTDIAVFQKVARNQILFWQGDEAGGFYLLLHGRIRIYKASPEGKEYTIHLIRPGQMFAEAAIFTGSKFPANCMALEDSEVVFFPKEAFLQLVRSSPDISLKMIAGLSAFVREFNQMVEDLSLKEVPARLATYLLSEYERQNSASIALDVSKAALASKLGASAETLSRNFKKLKELEAIKMDGDRIHLCDLQTLRDIADGQKI